MRPAAAPALRCRHRANFILVDWVLRRTAHGWVSRKAAHATVGWPLQLPTPLGTPSLLQLGPSPPSSLPPPSLPQLPAAYFMVKEQVPHLWPLSRVLQPWPMGERFFWETKRGGEGPPRDAATGAGMHHPTGIAAARQPPHAAAVCCCNMFLNHRNRAGVLSYVIARPLMTAVSVVANIAGVYGEGEFRRDRWVGGVGGGVGCELGLVGCGGRRECRVGGCHPAVPKALVCAAGQVAVHI